MNPFRDFYANQATLRVEEPSWYLCGDYVRRIYVFEPAASIDHA